MNIKFFNVALCIAFAATTLSASAQTNYTEGVITLSTTMRGQQVQPKTYFRADSAAIVVNMGPANIKILSDSKGTFFAVLVDVPVASIKKAGISSPAEIEQAMDAAPKFTFAPTTETKTIGKFNCKKVVATDSKTKKTYDVWVTSDVTVPENAISKYYAGIGGFPIQYTSFAQGQEAPVTVLDITQQKVPAGTFGIAPDFDKVTMEDLNSMGGGR